MKTIVESIRDRRGGSYQPILKKISNPTYNDLKLFNIIKMNETGGSLYGIIVDKSDARELFNGYPYSGGSIVFYNINPHAGNLAYLNIKEYKDYFPNPSWDESGKEYRIESIWDGSGNGVYFARLLRDSSGYINEDALVNFLKPSYYDPKEFEKMLSK